MLIQNLKIITIVTNIYKYNFFFTKMFLVLKETVGPQEPHQRHKCSLYRNFWQSITPNDYRSLSHSYPVLVTATSVIT